MAKSFAKQFKKKNFPLEPPRPEDGRERVLKTQKSINRKRHGIILGGQQQAFPGQSGVSSFGPNKKLKRK